MPALILALVLTLLLAPAAIAQSEDSIEPPSSLLLLVHSELEYLSVANHRISIEFKNASPVVALRQLSKKARLSFEVRNTLPNEAKLTASFRDVTVKEVLDWFAEETDVFYRVEQPDRLLVLFQKSARRDDDSQPDKR